MKTQGNGFFVMSTNQPTVSMGANTGQGLCRTWGLFGGRFKALLRSVLLGGVLLGGFAGKPVWAEYRAYEMEVVDITECRLTKSDPCPSVVVRSGLDPNTYASTHGGDRHVAALLLATWMCYGDTSNRVPICPRPLAKKARFQAGQTVRIALKKHVSEGWVGKVERAYYQHSVRSNVYGVRFLGYQNLYARYYEKDLAKATPEEK